jgi:hypothetical protein
MVSPLLFPFRKKDERKALRSCEEGVIVIIAHLLACYCGFEYLSVINDETIDQNELYR